MNLSQQDIEDLIEVLNIALYDTHAMIAASHDGEEVAAYREQQARIRQWIHRLSQSIGTEPGKEGA